VSARRPRVAHVGTFKHDSADGTDKTVAGLVSWLPQHGFDVEVWQLARGETRIRSSVVDGVTVWHLPAHHAPRNMLLGAPSPARHFARERSARVDLVHFHSGLIPDHVDLASQVVAPYVIAPNGMYMAANLHGRYWWFKQAWLRLRERPFIRGAHLLHAVSEAELLALRRAFPRSTLALIPNALDFDRIPNVAAMRRSDSPVLLYLGRLGVEQKGLDLLLRGFGQYLQRTGDAATRLVLVGPDYRGGQRELTDMIARLHLGSRVEIREPVFGPAKWALLGSAAAFVHPSRWDGLPFSVLEALAVGRPVLVTPGTNIADLVETYGAGVAVQPQAPDVARGLEGLLRANVSEQDQMARAARRLVLDNFTWPESARRMADAYATVLGCEGRVVGGLAADSTLSAAHPSH
jgi:glycosyltransferase involved in cell wall biosynthesis